MTDEYSFRSSNGLCLVIKEDFSEPNIPITKSHSALYNTCQTGVEKPLLAKEGAKGKGCTDFEQLKYKNN